MSAVLAPPRTDDDPVDDLPPSRLEVAVRLTALVVGTAAVTALVAELFGWAWVAVVWAVIVIIMLHEAGHFVTAKWAGMKATEFFVGFGPRLWSIRHGETEYGVKALPLGGYVKILGMTSMEELDPSDEPRSYVNQSTSKRVLVASAGSLVHFGLAIVLAFFLLWTTGENVSGPYEQVVALTTTGHVVTPAMAAGLRAGDLLVSVDHRAVGDQQALVSAIQASHGRAVPVVVLRTTHVAGSAVTRRLVLLVTPRHLSWCSSALCVGIQAAVPTHVHPVGVLGAVGGAASATWETTTATVAAFVHAFSPSGLTSLAKDVANSKAGAAANRSPEATHSLPGFLTIAADAFRAGARQFLAVLIALNVSLGVLNMLPMLPLDGGHVAIALYERVRTRRGRARYRADVSKLLPVVYAFMGFLLLFVAGRMYLDLAHGVGNPFG